MHINEAVVISLRDRTERLGVFSANLPTPWPFPPLMVAPGVREEAPAWYRSSDGAWGCRQAHLQILRSAWQRGVESTLVLEDDAVFADDFVHTWKRLRRRIPARTAMLMLGGEHIEEPMPAGRDLVRCINTRRTHAYVIRLHAIPLLIRTWERANRHIDHALVDFQTAAWVYATSPFLVGQNRGWSDISRRHNSDIRFWGTSVDAQPGLD